MSLDLPDNDNGETCALGLEDLLTALGSIEISHDPIHGRLMGRDQMLLLDKVFRCPNFSFADAAEQLRRLEKN